MHRWYLCLPLFFLIVFHMHATIASWAAAEENALSPLVSHFTEGWAKAAANPKYDQSNVEHGLASTDFRCPKMDEVCPLKPCSLLSPDFYSSPGQSGAVIGDGWGDGRRLVGDRRLSHVPDPVWLHTTSCDGSKPRHEDRVEEPQLLA